MYNDLIQTYLAAQRLTKAVKEGRQVEDWVIQALVESVDRVKFDEVLVDTETTEVV